MMIMIKRKKEKEKSIGKKIPSKDQILCYIYEKKIYNVKTYES